MSTFFTFFVRRKWLTALLVLLIILAGFYVAGYRIAPGPKIVRAGTLVLDGMVPGSSIFVNEKFHSRSDGKTARLSLLPGTHNILIGTDTYYPWNELVPVESGKDIQVRPLFIFKAPEQTTLPEDTREAVKQTVGAVRIPTKANPLFAVGGCALVYVEGNRILVEATTTSSTSCEPPPYLCTSGVCEPTMILAPQTSIRQVFLYPGRQDTVVVSFGPGIYALEIDPRQPEFFAPIFRGKEPSVAPKDESTLFLFDRETPYQIPLSS